MLTHNTTALLALLTHRSKADATVKTTTLSIAISPAPPSVRFLSILMAPALAIIMGIDLRIRGAEEILVHGFADEIAHVLTALIILSAVRAIGVRIFWPVVLVGAVLPDVEYLFFRMDIHLFDIVAEGSRGALHTLAPGAAVVALGLVLPPLRVFLVSLGLAMLTHPVRDAATSSAPMLWPLIPEAYHLRYSFFLAILAICAIITAGMVALAPIPGQRPVVQARDEERSFDTDPALTALYRRPR